MKQFLFTLLTILFVTSANAQDHTYIVDTTKDCFDQYYKAFEERGALPVPDGEHEVVYSARKDTTCFCGEGKVIVKGGVITPQMQVKKTDSTYEDVKKVLHPKKMKDETGRANQYTVSKGMSQSFLTDDYYVINIFFVEYLKRKVVPNIEAPSPDDIAGKQIQMDPKEKEVLRKAYEGLRFENGKSTIKSSSYPHLNLLASMLQEKPDYKLSVNGYTDNVGSAESNLVLSKNRAEAVKTYLIKQGIDATRITADGYGMENPIADNKTSEGRAQNRRVEFFVTH